MLTKQHNFSLVEGQKSRIVVLLPEGTDATGYEVYAGNDQCPCRHLAYEVESVVGNRITLLSEPAPNCITIPYQLFVRDKTTNVEWLVVSGNIAVIKRCVGQSSTSSQEVNAPVNEEFSVYTIEITYDKHDLDEAVRIANTAAVAAIAAARDAGTSARDAKRWAIGEPAEPEGHSSKYWAQLAEQSAIDAGSHAVDAQYAAADAWVYTSQAEGFSGQAETFKNQAESFKSGACNASIAATQARSLACQYANQASSAKSSACQYANQASSAKTAACTAAAEVEGYVAAACSAASAANSYAETASTAATNAYGYSVCAQQYMCSAQSAASIACSQAISASASAGVSCNHATCSYNWAQTALSAKTTSCYNACATATYRAAACCAAYKAGQLAKGILVYCHLYAAEIENYYIEGGHVAVLDPPCSGSSALDASGIKVTPNATGEVMIDYGSDTFEGKEVIFPESWRWIEEPNESAPTFEKGRVYRIVVRDESQCQDCVIIANVAYDYPKNK